MMPSNPGTLPNQIVGEPNLSKPSTNNGTKRNNHSYQQHYHQEEKLIRSNRNTKNQSDTSKEAIEIISPKPQNKRRVHPPPLLMFPVNSDLLKTTPADKEYSLVNKQSYRQNNYFQEMNHVESGSSSTNQNSGIILPSKHNSTNPDFVIASASNSACQQTTNAEKIIATESRTRRIKENTSEQYKSLVSPPVPAEDIVETVMPLDGSQSGLKLFEAPPWMKRNDRRSLSPSGKRTPTVVVGATPSPTSRSFTPLIIERPAGYHTLKTTKESTASHFRRVGSLPHSATYSKRLSSSMPATASSFRTEENEISIRKGGSVSPTSHQVSDETDYSKPVQIVRTSKHDDEQMIEIVRERGAESRSSVSTYPKPPRSPRSKEVRSRFRSNTPGSTLPHHSEVNHLVSVTGSKYDDMSASALGTAHSQHTRFFESGASPMFERTTYRSSLPPPRNLRATHSTPASPTMGYSANRSATATSSLLRSHNWIGESPNSGLPPPANRVQTSRLTNTLRSGTTLTDDLVPTGPPVERMTTRVDPVTGMLQRVTERTQSFSDISKNVFVTETNENIEDDQAIQHHITRRIIRKHRPSSLRDSRSATRIEKTVEPVHQTQLFHSKSMDENVEQWHRQFSNQQDARPYRAVSQTNVSSRQPLAQNQWISESNLRTTTTYKQPPMYSTYSARRENQRKMEEERRNVEDWSSNRHLEEAKSAAGTEVLEEMETITLQPIGRGVHDLEPTGSIARSYRANTPTGLTVTRASPVFARSLSLTERITPYSPAARRPLFRPDLSSPRYNLNNARPESNNVAHMLSSPPLSAVPDSSHWGSISSSRENYATRQTSSQRYNERLGLVYNNQPQSPTSSRNVVMRRGPSPEISSTRDLISPISDSRMVYKNSPITSRYASLAFTQGPDHSDAYRTIATTNLHREVHTSSAPSPYAGSHHKTFYENTNRGVDPRFTGVTSHSETHWRGTDSLNPTYAGSFAHAGSVSGVSGHGEVVDSEQALLRQVKQTHADWYLPEKTREEVNALLADREPGSFIIRNSISYVNSFSIGLKIPQNSPHFQTRPDDIKSGYVRHFIIGTVPMSDGRGDGLQLCGFANQPIFPNLVAFVCHHILHPGPFPCPLRLPGASSHSNIIPIQQSRINYASQTGMVGSTGLTNIGGDGIAADMLYLGQVEVDRLESAVAVRRAITQILSQAAHSSTGLPKRCEVLIKVIPHDGITFMDKTKRTMLRKHIKPSHLLWCGLDPENRIFTDPELRARGLPSPRTFGLVARRQNFFMHENVVYVFSELDPSQSAINLCNYINGVFPNH